MPYMDPMGYISQEKKHMFRQTCLWPLFHSRSFDSLVSFQTLKTCWGRRPATPRLLRMVGKRHTKSMMRIGVVKAPAWAFRSFLGLSAYQGPGASARFSNKELVQEDLETHTHKDCILTIQIQQYIIVSACKYSAQNTLNIYSKILTIEQSCQTCFTPLHIFPSKPSGSKGPQPCLI